MADSPFAGIPRTPLYDRDLFDLSRFAEEQADVLTKLNLRAIDHGIVGEVSDDFVIKLMQHQSALSEFILTLVEWKSKHPPMTRRYAPKLTLLFVPP